MYRCDVNRCMNDLFVCVLRGNFAYGHNTEVVVPRMVSMSTTAKSQTVLEISGAEWSQDTLSEGLPQYCINKKCRAERIHYVKPSV